MRTRNMTKKVIAVIVLAAILLTLVVRCGNNSQGETEVHSKDRVCMITDAGDITDQSFNQTTYEACRDYCRKNNIDFTYKKPDGDTNYSRTAMVDVAVAEGYNIIVMAGYVFAESVNDVTEKYPDIRFISLDMSGGDICASAVGNTYYDNPDKYKTEDYYNENNTYCAIYQENIPGYLAGYAAVKLGYRHLGFLGGQAVPGVMRYGYGYVQGIDAAAKDLGITDEVTIEYAYGGQFYGSTEITAAMDAWFANGTEIVFACGGGIYTSAAEAAAKVDGKMIGVDSDQSPIIDKYGEKMTVTSAMKSLTATINATLDSIIFEDTWKENVGKIQNLGLVSKDDLSKNFVGLPLETTQWNDDFTIDDYKELIGEIYDGKIVINNDTSKMPEVSVKMNVREGTIK